MLCKSNLIQHTKTITIWNVEMITATAIQMWTKSVTWLIIRYWSMWFNSVYGLTSCIYLLYRFTVDNLKRMGKTKNWHKPMHIFTSVNVDQLFVHCDGWSKRLNSERRIIMKIIRNEFHLPISILYIQFDIHVCIRVAGLLECPFFSFQRLEFESRMLIWTLQIVGFSFLLLFVGETIMRLYSFGTTWKTTIFTSIKLSCIVLLF